ncbi:hypothetical protein PRZ48_014250 [Zasmidium cellare]|uniref:RNA helicase n=1 Tax=Zasmidium cellare TaxID=395010 RepID=A0ABR0E0Q0_ZASCE|nr:hypothetical protein PRZ48_014250 [Zasmidium cellare]
MLAISNNGSICARCVLRRRILAFQQSRRRSSNNYSYKNYKPSNFSAEKRDGPAPKHFNQEAARLLDEFATGSIISKPFPQKKSSSDETRDGSLPIRYNLSKPTLQTSSEARHRAAARGVRKLESEGPVRKYFKGGLKQWGLDEQSLSNKKTQAFRDVLAKRLNVVREEVKHAPMLEDIAKDARETDGDKNGKEQSFNRLWRKFTQTIWRDEENAGGGLGGLFGDVENTKRGLWDDLSLAYRTRGVSGLDDRIKYAFYGHVNNSRFTESDMKNQKTLADLRYPTEWFPATRAMQRKIVLHVGPTNSGKTYHALQKLEQADRGVYAGPLRLLAHEVYTRLNAKGKPCALITGEERRAAEDQGEDNDMSACTVEMMPLNKTLDVAVIDEIQMIGNAERGWAWTQALLGVKAKEVHLCGEERTVPLVKEICASIGEELEINRYERLSPLQMAERSLDGKLAKLRKGDCIVSFTVMGIHALRREIEKISGKKVAIVYGSLPPETRAQQARLFNDPNNDYDFLVASDAVGMGLNLAIKRIVFETATKFDGISRRTLSIADIKQIGGRAGRFRTAQQANEAPASEQDLAAAKGEAEMFNPDDTPDNVGLVTTLERFDFPIVQSGMVSEPEPISSAGIFPPAPVLERFASYFPPRTPFSYILTRLHDISQMHKRFHLCGLKDQVWVADLIEPVQGLTVADRNQICSCPCSKGDNDLWKDLMPAYARCIADQTGGNIVEIKELPLELLEKEPVASREYLRELERLHKGVVAYLWLSYRFAGIFNTRPLAFHIKSMVEERIEHVLGKFSFSETARRRLAERREKEILEGLMIGSEEQPAPRAEDVAAEHAEGEEQDVEQQEEDIENKMEEFAEEEPAEDQGDGGAESEDTKILGLESSEAERKYESPSHEDTSLTAGGDRFGGEEEISLEEPAMLDVMREEGSESEPESNESEGESPQEDSNAADAEENPADSSAAEQLTSQEESKVPNAEEKPSAEIESTHTEDHSPQEKAVRANKEDVEEEQKKETASGVM